jgi:RNA polymerase sigma factor (sigma-70 family)
MKDNEIISLIRSGGQQHLGLIYEKYRSEFIHWVSKEFKCSLDDSKDIYQVTIMIFYENILSGRLNTLVSSIKTYLFGIGKNVARENQRRLSRVVSIDVEQWLNEFYADKECELLDERAFEAANRAIGQLGETGQKLIQLFYHQHKSMEEISAILNYKNAETAKNQKCKSMAILRKLFHAELQVAEKLSVESNAA